jgi:hypothetical protein
MFVVKQIDCRGIGGTMPGEQAFGLLLICEKGRPEWDGFHGHVAMLSQDVFAVAQADRAMALIEAVISGSDATSCFERQLGGKS